MAVNFWWIYDIILILVVILSVYSCSKKGFSKIIILTIGCVISIFLASFTSQKSSEFIYEKFIKKSSMESVSTSIEDYKPEVSVKEVIEDQNYGAVLEENRVKNILSSDDSMEMLYEYANQAAGTIVDTHENFRIIITDGFADKFAAHLGVELPPYVTYEIVDKVSQNEELFLEITDMILGNPDEVPQYIEKNYIRNPAIRLVKAFVFIISYFIFITLVRIVINRTFHFGLLNGYDKLDRTVGGVLGIIQAVANLVIISVFIKIIISIIGSDNSIISYETVENTKLFKHIFNRISF